MTTFEEIEKLANQQIENAGVKGVFPVPLETIAGNLGFRTMSITGKPDISGAIDHKNKTIYVNQDEALVRQRFTIAHEIGHAVLHGGEDVIDYRRDMGSPKNRKEIEANAFAANLLMPREEFKAFWKKKNGFFQGALQPYFVSAKFGVSEAAAKFRAKNLGLADA